MTASEDAERLLTLARELIGEPPPEEHANAG